MGLTLWRRASTSIYMETILLIDDEPAITESLGYALKRAGFTTKAASTLEMASAMFNESAFDCIILDLMLPDGNGLDWLRTIRQGSTVPVIILSSHDAVVDRVVGLEMGADDYVNKPFSPREVVARIRAILRRSIEEVSTSIIERGILRIDTGRRAAWAGTSELGLSRTEFELFRLFLASPGKAFDREQILNEVWGPDVAVTERTIDVHVKTLRKKLTSAGVEAEVIETVRGIGYRLGDFH